MVQIYGIDLSMEKFDVSFCTSDGKLMHKQITNNLKCISTFLLKLPNDALLCAEYTGVYGDLLVFLAEQNKVPISLVSGYEIKHSLGLQRGKSDLIDADRIREYADRFKDKLQLTHFQSEQIYELEELYRTRNLLIESRKRIQTAMKSEDHKPFVSLAANQARNSSLLALNSQIAQLENQIQELIYSNKELKENYEIVTSITGIGPVTACDLIIKTGNFKRIDTARKCAAYAAVAPYPKSSGKMSCNNKISNMGDVQLKSLLFLCANSAKVHNKEILLYFRKKYEVEKKPFFLVMNNISNKLLHIMYALIKKQEKYDRTYIQLDPREKQIQELIN